MRDALSPIGAPRRRAAIGTVGTWIASLPGGPRPLAPGELHAYAVHQVTEGWRLQVQFPDRPRRLDLLLDGNFPRMPPKVALVDRPAFLTWPHIEEDGTLCLLPGSASVSVSHPKSVAAAVLAAACELIEDLAAGRRVEDFRAEFESYWDRQATEGAPTLYSLVDPAPPTRPTRVWRGRQYYVLGDDAAIRAWLRHRSRGEAGGPWTTEPAALLWLERALLPNEYPRTAAGMLSLARTCGGGEMLEQLAVESKDNIVLLIVAPTPNGPCLAGVTIPAPGAAAWKPITRGFRPGKVPRKLLVTRYLGGTAVHRSSVDRADPTWVHGRGQDERAGRLRAATVAVLGCGSVGAPVALQLAAAGVGRFVLLDPKKMTWANVGRHPLGASAVGNYKVAALAERIRRSYPHVVGVESLPLRWQDVRPDTLNAIASCDLIVSAMGDWAGEGALNEWHFGGARSGPIIYGWTEPYACAGHAIAVCPGGACFQCGFTHSGVPLLRVTDWPQGPTLRQEPACGAIYQPYGPVELGHIISLVAELAIDCVLGRVVRSTHRIWAGRRPLLASAGGDWTPEWATIAHDRLQGGFVEEREWLRSAACIECGAGAA